MERREHPRLDARIEVSFSTPEAYVTEYTKNISKGGAFLKTDRLPDPNALVELTIAFPNSKTKTTVLAKVVRSVTLSDPDRPGEHLYGVGFHFLEWDSETRKCFDEFYEKLVNQVGT